MANNNGRGNVVTTNRRARHDYFVEDEYEAGLVLKGAEVKSLRNHHCSIAHAYASIDNGEAWVYNMHIKPYDPAADELDPERPRKLLLTKRQIGRLRRDVQEKGYTLIPLQVYFNSRGYAKVKIGVCEGKKKWDKREAIKEREYERRKQRAIADRMKGRDR